MPRKPSPNTKAIKNEVPTTPQRKQPSKPLQNKEAAVPVSLARPSPQVVTPGKRAPIDYETACRVRYEVDILAALRVRELYMCANCFDEDTDDLSHATCENTFADEGSFVMHMFNVHNLHNLRPGEEKFEVLVKKPLMFSQMLETNFFAMDHIEWLYNGLREFQRNGGEITDSMKERAWERFRDHARSVFKGVFSGKKGALIEESTFPLPQSPPPRSTDYSPPRSPTY